MISTPQLRAAACYGAEFLGALGGSAGRVGNGPVPGLAGLAVTFPPADADATTPMTAGASS